MLLVMLLLMFIVVYLAGQCVLPSGTQCEGRVQVVYNLDVSHLMVHTDCVSLP